MHVQCGQLTLAVELQERDRAAKHSGAGHAADAGHGVFGRHTNHKTRQQDAWCGLAPDAVFFPTNGYACKSNRAIYY